jgi:acetyl-CoA carboxylase carboxyl transferase subunit alpha
VTVDDSNFEAPLAELRQRIHELEGYPPGRGHEREIERLRRQLEKETRQAFKSLTPWQTVLVARHAERPYTLDYVERLMTDWVELHGDRAFRDDPSIVAGLARFEGQPVAVVGHQKGRGTKERIHRNFGQPRPEGYRKALRVMKLAERFGLPVICLIDTPGAYPGIGAEERGQAEAIARNLIEMASLRVPIAVVITGEGGSGGALALGVGNHVAILEHAIYSVISPEGCAAILWKDQERRADAADAMKVTAGALLEHGVVDEVIPEPLGGAHTDPDETARRVGACLSRVLGELAVLPADELVRRRRARFRRLGVVAEAAAGAR